MKSFYKAFKFLIRIFDIYVNYNRKIYNYFKDYKWNKAKKKERSIILKKLKFHQQKIGDTIYFDSLMVKHLRKGFITGIQVSTPIGMKLLKSEDVTIKYRTSFFEHNHHALPPSKIKDCRMVLIEKDYKKYQFEEPIRI